VTAKPCPMPSKYKIIKEQLIELFETKTIRQLADDIRVGEVVINNSNK
jgi:Rrf2 family transcriptional regulator, iron-sulfur cluster assembly transcription factor